MRFLLAANGAGPVHIVRPAGSGFTAACYRRVSGPRVESYAGRKGRQAWHHGPRCSDCEALSARTLRAFRQATGWR